MPVIDISKVDVSKIPATVDQSIIVRLPYGSDASWSELYDWCEQNCTGEWAGHPKTGRVKGMAFVKKEDAVLFSLRWL